MEICGCPPLLSASTSLPYVVPRGTFHGKDILIDREDIMAMNLYDPGPSIDLLLSSPPTMLVSNVDFNFHPTIFHYDASLNSETATQSLAHTRLRQPSTSSESSVPDMVGGVGTCGSDTSHDSRDYHYHASTAAMWDAWHESCIEEDSLSSVPYYVGERTGPLLRSQRSNFALHNVGYASSDLTKMRSVGDLRGSYATPTQPYIKYRPQNPYCTCTLPSCQSIHIPTRYYRDTQLLSRRTSPSRPVTSPQSVPRPPFSSTRLTFEPRTQDATTIIDASLNTVLSPSEALPPVGEVSVFEDWEDPKTTFWHITRKRKRREWRAWKLEECRQ